MREPLRTRTGVVVFGIMGGLMAAYLVWLIVDAPQSLQAGWLNGWVGTGFRLAAAVICLIGGVRRRPGSLVPLVFGSALLFTTIGNIILTVDSRHGPPPPPPTPADFFGLGTIVLCFVGIGLMARHDRGSLSPRESLDGAIAAMGAGAVCAAFLLAHLPHGPGLSTEGAADLLAYPIGYVVLVLIVVGAATVAGKRSRVPWEALTAAFALLALGSALGSTAVGHSEAVQILTEIQWPAATLLIAASMWADPGVPDPLAVRRGIVVWLPALACAATIVVLFAATLTHVDHVATALATAALILVMLRAYSELRQEIAARQRTEMDLRASEAGYRRIAIEQSALHRIATLVAHGAAPGVVFTAVAEEVGRAVPNVEISLVGRYAPDATIEYVGAWEKGGHPPNLIGDRLPLGGDNVAALVFDGHRPARVDHPPEDAVPSSVLVRPWARSSAGVPINVEGGLWGVMIVASRERGELAADVELELADFTELVGTAIANAQARAELMASRSRLVASADETRRKIERDLHDGAQQQFVSVAMQLRAVQASVPPDQAKLVHEIDRVVARLSSALDDLREFSRGIHPAILEEAGLGAALRTLAHRSSVPVGLEMRIENRLPERVEVTAYYMVSEALTNAAKHANATMAHVDVDVDVTHTAVRLAVRDDGVGGADPARGSGLLGICDRVEAAGGTIAIRSPVGEGTELLAELPL